MEEDLQGQKLDTDTNDMIFILIYWGIDVYMYIIYIDAFLIVNDMVLFFWCAGYIDWITQAEELAELEAEDQQNAIKVTRRDDGGYSQKLRHFYSGWPQLRQAEQHRGRAPQVSHAAPAAGGGW